MPYEPFLLGVGVVFNLLNNYWHGQPTAAMDNYELVKSPAILFRNLFHNPVGKSQRSQFIFVRLIFVIVPDLGSLGRANLKDCKWKHRK